MFCDSLVIISVAYSPNQSKPFQIRPADLWANMPSKMELQDGQMQHHTNNTMLLLGLLGPYQDSSHKSFLNLHTHAPSTLTAHAFPLFHGYPQVHYPRQLRATTFDRSRACFCHVFNGLQEKKWLANSLTGYIPLPPGSQAGLSI